ncbi:MAG: peptide chain release factor 1 [Candidatus Saccharimonadaceae bacterium]|nr:peptide chain release factor 1 [Candidatus Saccharimonadaceae bacterium]
MDIAKLKIIETEYRRIENQLADPDIISNRQKLCSLSIRRKELEPLVENFREYREIESEICSLQEMVNDQDPEMALLAKEELSSLSYKKQELADRLLELLKPQDPLDGKNIIIEIRAAAGGEEAALFAADLFRMYSHYAEMNRLKFSVLESSNTDLGGLKELILSVEGNGAYGLFKFESGTHRVQRVPQTEASGRLHTSTVTVAIMPEPEQEDLDIILDPNDLRIDTFRSGGAGGQHTNKTDSAVRITHMPTNLVVVCQDERSQLKNKTKAMKILKARLYDLNKREQAQKIAKDRKQQVGTGDRSEKIRTYNFPQDRITDHRANQNWHNIENILDGNMDELVNALKEVAYYDESTRTFEIRKS